MTGMFTDKVMRVALLLSLTGHLLLLGAPFELRPNLQKEKKSKDLELVYIEIERPPLLPKIEVMGEEKKLKEVVEESRSPEPELEPKPQPEEVIVEAPFKVPEPPRKFVKVMDPQDEAMLRYQDMVKQRIEEVRRYPPWAKKQGIEGGVCLRFLILSNGSAQEVKLLRSSGSKILDEEAIATIKRANPFPPIPAMINTPLVQMEVSIVFALK